MQIYEVRDCHFFVLMMMIRDWKASTRKSVVLIVAYKSIITNQIFPRSYNLRLESCNSEQGAMTKYFPIVISPDTTHDAISGYVKSQTHEGGN